MAICEAAMSYLPAVMIGKVVAGVLALLLAFPIYRHIYKEGERV